MKRKLLAAAAVGLALSVLAAPTRADPTSDARVFQVYRMQGAVTPFRDPSIIRQGRTYYVFGTDMDDGNFASLPIRCSSDAVTWTACGSVFKGVPQWLKDQVPGLGGLWAPDISYFRGLYHLYYAASTFGSNRSVIALATNVTLDQKGPALQMGRSGHGSGIESW